MMEKTPMEPTDQRQDRRDAKRAAEKRRVLDNRRSVRIIAMLSTRPKKRRKR